MNLHCITLYQVYLVYRTFYSASSTSFHINTTLKSTPYLASRPEVGSSMNMTEGEATISLAMVSRFRCSTESPLSPGTPTCGQQIIKQVWGPSGTVPRSIGCTAPTAHLAVRYVLEIHQSDDLVHEGSDLDRLRKGWDTGVTLVGVTIGVTA